MLAREDRSEDDECIDCNCNEMRHQQIAQIKAIRSVDVDRETRANVCLTYVVFCQETWTELQVVVQVEGTASLKPSSKSRHCWGLCQLLHAAHSSELTMGVLR